MTDEILAVWRVTTRCNFDCMFCEYRFSNPTARQESTEELASRVVAFLAELSDLRQRRVHLSVLGGEPLLWGELPRLVEMAGERSISVGITTNGSLLAHLVDREPRLLQLSQVTVSLDGLPPQHRVGRNLTLRHSDRLYAGLRSAVVALNERGCLTRVAMILTASNVATLLEAGTWFASLGFQQLAINQLCGSPGDSYFDLERLRPEHIADLQDGLADLSRALSEAGLELLLQPRYLSRLYDYATGSCRPVWECEPGQHRISIDPDGVVAPCDYTHAEFGVSLRAEPNPLAVIGRMASAKRARMASSCWDCPATHPFGKFAPSRLGVE